MGIYTQNKELTPAAWRSFDYEGIFTMNPFYGQEHPLKQMDNFTSNIYLIQEVSEFDSFFQLKK